MALVLVWHDISNEVVELEERHLAHPVLGQHYHIVKTNDDGKRVVSLDGKAKILDKAGHPHASQAKAAAEAAAEAAEAEEELSVPQVDPLAIAPDVPVAEKKDK